MRTEDHDVDLYHSELESDPLPSGGVGPSEPRPVKSSTLNRGRFAELAPKPPALSRFSKLNGGDPGPSSDYTRAWVASQEAPRMRRTASVSTLNSSSTPLPPGRPHVRPTPSPVSEPHMSTPIQPHRPMSDRDGHVPLLDDDAMPNESGRQTRFSPRPVTPSRDSDSDDWRSRASSPVFTDPPVSDSSRSDWHDSHFQRDSTPGMPGMPGMPGPGRPRPPGMTPPNNPWTSQFRPWQNMMQGGFGIAAMIAETFINVVQSIAQIFQKWGESMVSLTRR